MLLLVLMYNCTLYMHVYVYKISAFIHEQIYKWILETFLILYSKVFVIELDNKALIKKEIFNITGEQQYERVKTSCHKLLSMTYILRTTV